LLVMCKPGKRCPAWAQGVLNALPHNFRMPGCGS